MAGRKLNSVFQVQNKKTIDILLSEIRSSGVVKTNQFEVHINFPPGFSPDIERDKSIILRAQSVSMPGTNLSTVTDNNIYGPDRNIVSGVTYANEVSVTFLLDSKMKIRTYFEDWQKLTYDEKSWNLKYYDTYVGTVDIFSLSNNLETSNAFKPSGNLKDTPDYGLRCWKAYPITIGQVEFSSSNANTLGTIDIGFSFRYTTNIDRWESDEPFNVYSRKTSNLDDSPPNNVEPSTFKSDSVNGVPTTVSVDTGDVNGARTSGQKTPASTRIGAGQSLAGIPESMDSDSGAPKTAIDAGDFTGARTSFSSDFNSGAPKTAIDAGDFTGARTSFSSDFNSGAPKTPPTANEADAATLARVAARDYAGKNAKRALRNQQSFSDQAGGSGEPKSRPSRGGISLKALNKLI